MVQHYGMCLSSEIQKQEERPRMLAAGFKQTRDLQIHPLSSLHHQFLVTFHEELQLSRA
jgi:hypothetical protein